MPGWTYVQFILFFFFFYFFLVTNDAEASLPSESVNYKGTWGSVLFVEAITDFNE